MSKTYNVHSGRHNQTVENMDLCLCDVPSERHAAIPSESINHSHQLCPAKPKWRYLLTYKVNKYYLLAYHGRAVVSYVRRHLK